MARQNRQSKEPRVKKFRVTLADDNTHRQLSVVKFTRWSFFTTVISIVLLILIAVMAAVALTPLKTYIPGYSPTEGRRNSDQTAMRIDSLNNVIARWEFYSENIRRVLDGDDPVKIDSIVKSYTPARDTMDAAAFHVRDSLLRQKVLDAEQFSVSSTSQARALPLEGQHFFTPLKGVVSEKYDKVLHPYIEISAPANSVVMSVLDGTVISADWSDEHEYTIMVQHRDDILSIYRRNQKLLHKVGDRIKAGTPIALVGSSEASTADEHLRFELWHNGDTVNPTDFISF
ncbi:MAG: M23 family metallopeptidase [Bacteroidales bacterium]|nr:M23 family metallopeptidase [Bacteroidales bacterium]